MEEPNGFRSKKSTNNYKIGNCGFKDFANKKIIRYK